MSKTFDKLINLSPRDIITTLERNSGNINEDVECQMTSHEAALYFQNNAALTLEELNALMDKKIDEMSKQ